jgi:hypothetical protein
VRGFYARRRGLLQQARLLTCTPTHAPAPRPHAATRRYLNGHDHIAEVLENAGTTYVVTGAGSAIRTNNAPAAGDDDAADDDSGGADPGNPSAALSQYLLEDNAFTVHSFNATSSAVAIVSYNGSVMYYQERPLLAKLQRGAEPPVPAIPGCNPSDATNILRGECLTWLQ